MTTEVAKTETNLPATAQAADSGLLSSDFIVPKILLMQGLSDLVAERKAVAGDIVRNTTEEKLGDDTTPPLDFIPLKVTSDWTEKEKVGQKFEYRRTLPRTANNEMLPWSYWKAPTGQEYDKPGALGATEWQRVKCLNVFSLLPRDIDAFDAEIARAAEAGDMPDISKVVLPVMISFRSTSFNAGKTVSTFLAQVQEMQTYAKNVKHYAYALPLSCVGDKNDKGSYFIYKVGTPKKLEPKYVEAAERWFMRLSAMKEIKVDNSGETEVVQESNDKY